MFIQSHIKLIKKYIHSVRNILFQINAVPKTLSKKAQPFSTYDNNKNIEVIIEQQISILV